MQKGPLYFDKNELIYEKLSDENELKVILIEMNTFI